MKKIILLCLLFFSVQVVSEARDYTKLHMDEMKKSQKYSASKKYFEDYKPEIQASGLKLKDPKLIKLSGYEYIPVDKFKAKLAKDAKTYNEIRKYLTSSNVDNYHMQAYGDDFYQVYRVAEKIIRANSLDFVNWRISVDSENTFNAFNAETNHVCVLAGALDTLSDNEDALALLLGHEFAHGLLGHAQRKAKYYAKMERAKRIGSYGMYHVARKRLMALSRKLEFVADVEGAKLAAKAGYNLENGKELLSFLNTQDYSDEWNASHPSPEKRLKNFADNKKYFMENEWLKQGAYNIYNSEVLSCEKSSNRKSMILGRGKRKSNSEYYSPETAEQLYLRFGYKSYVNGEFKDSINYFKKYLKINKGNYAVYLYLSYANEYLYKQSGSEKYLEEAKAFADYAKLLAPENRYVEEQISAL